MKKNTLLLILSVLLLNSNIFSSPLINSFSGKEVTIDFRTTLEEILKNKKELSFLLITEFTNEELEAWEKQVKSDQNVKQIKLKKASNNKDWEVVLSLKDELNRSNAKMLFSFSLKTDYVIIDNEKMLFNVFVSKYIPN